MATYFVKTGGSDAANGLSDANAWATINKINTSSFSAGDIIQLRRGDLWREQLTVPSSGSNGSPILFTHYGSSLAPPRLNGGDLMTSWTDDGGNVWRATLNSQPQVVLFDGVLGIPVASKAAIDQPTEWFWSANLLYTYGTVNPTSTYATIEAAVRPTNDEALFNFNGKSYVELDGLDFWISNDVGVKNYAATAGQTWRKVRNCRVYYTADGGLCIYGDNHFFSATELLYNEIAYANLRNAANGDGALEGITVMKADGYEIAYNTVHHCAEEGIDSHGQSKNGRIHHNHVHTYIGTASFRPAIYADGGDNVEVDHNIAHGYNVNSCKGLQLNCENASHSSNNMRYHHNIVYDCVFGWEIANTGGGTGHANVQVHHNTFYKCSSFAIVFNSDILNKLSGTNEMRNNIFDTSGNNDIIDFSTGNYGIANFTIDTNFFVTGTPTETQGTNAVVAASPLFVSPATRDFVLQSTSPCRNAGVVIAGINDGYAESAPDIGALEYVGYIVVGADASLRHAKMAGAATAAYALAGTDASLERGFVLAALGGSYGLTGTAAELVYAPASAYILGAAGGGFAMAGTGASVLRGYAIPAESGNFAPFGFPVDLIRAFPAPPLAIHRATARIPSPHVGSGSIQNFAGSSVLDTYTTSNDELRTSNDKVRTSDAPMRYR